MKQLLWGSFCFVLLTACSASDRECQNGERRCVASNPFVQVCQGGSWVDDDIAITGICKENETYIVKDGMCVCSSDATSGKSGKRCAEDNLHVQAYQDGKWIDEENPSIGAYDFPHLYKCYVIGGEAVLKDECDNGVEGKNPAVIACGIACNMCYEPVCAKDDRGLLYEELRIDAEYCDGHYDVVDGKCVCK